MRVLLVEPAGFRTNFQAAAAGPSVAMNAAYCGTAADLVIKDRKSQHGREEGDPEKAGQAIVHAVTLVGDGANMEGLLRLPLAKGAVARAEAKIEVLRKNLQAARGIAEERCFERVSKSDNGDHLNAYASALPGSMCLQDKACSRSSRSARSIRPTEAKRIGRMCAVNDRHSHLYWTGLRRCLQSMRGLQEGCRRRRGEEARKDATASCVK